jgi:parallel beta-helix repeat protein
MRSILILSVLAFSLICFGCGGDDKDSGSTMSGRITIDGQTDYSGIHVALYDATTDANLQEAYDAHGTLGCPDYPAFDHRLATPLASADTGSDGSFSIGGLTLGKYHVVVSKTGFGCRYLYNWPIGQSLPTDLVLYPEVHVTAEYIDSDMTFASNHSYIIDSNTMFNSPSIVTIEPGAWIRISAAKRMELNCIVNVTATTNEPFHVTSNDQFNDTTGGISAADVDLFDGFILRPEGSITGNRITNGVFSFGNNELYSEITNTAGYTIEHCLLFAGNTGMRLFNEGVVNVSHCSFASMLSSASTGIYIDTVIGGTVSRCIFTGCHTGLYAGTYWYGTAENNWVSHNTRGIYLNQCAGTVQHNELSNNSFMDVGASQNLSPSDQGCTIELNTMKSPTAVYVIKGGTGSFYSSMNIRENNFIGNTWFFRIGRNTYIQPAVIYFTDNYFNGLSDTDAILSKIESTEDHPEEPLVFPSISIDGTLISMESDAGIE